MKKTLSTLLLFGSLSLAASAQDGPTSAPAFPGAEGYARYTTTGGRGCSTARIMHVTNLNDSGEGSFRNAVTASGRKIVVFDVSGVIELKSDIKISGNTTIMGQTAPGQGITLRYYTVNFSGDNIIMRYIRCRRGQEKDINDGADAAWTRNHKNIIIDHCSLSWSIDEVASFYDNRDFTMQWCTIGEALCNPGHSKGQHGYGGIWGGKNASFHHNMLIHLDNRVPRFNGARYGWQGYDQTKYSNAVLSERVDFRNCLMYNWGGGGCYGGPGGGFINMVNNYYKAGPGTKNKTQVTVASCCSSGNGGSDTSYYGLYSRYYINGNYVTAGGSAAENYDWKGFSSDGGSGKNQKFVDTNNYYGEGAGASLSVVLDQPIDIVETTTHYAEDAYQVVMQYAGACIQRDDVDARWAKEIASGTTSAMGATVKRAGLIDVVADQGDYVLATQGETRPAGYDTDKDGIPDAWEIANGLNPNDISDAITKTLDPKGYYTNLEVYCNSLVEEITKNQNRGAKTMVNEYWPSVVNPGSSAIDAVTSNPDVVSVELFNAQGVKVAEDAKGIVLKVFKMADGTKRVVKTIR